MKIHLISCHSILEYDLLKIFTELGHEVFSNGAYLDPKGHKQLPRPGVDGASYFPEYEELARKYPHTNLPPELIEPFDLILWMHSPYPLNENWEKVKHKKNVFYSIGQSTTTVENTIRRFRYEGLKIVRMSPMEKNIVGYVGEDAIIRFPKDPEEWSGWNGETKRAINMTQSLLGRRVFCHYDGIMGVLSGFPHLIYGSGNDDLGAANGGELPYDLMKGALRDNRAFIFGGTWPSPYTLALEEAMMTGIPIVALGQHLAEDLSEIAPNDRYHYYELGDIIEDGRNGFISENINELRNHLHTLLEDHDLARRISEQGRKTAIKYFDKEKIKKDWETFFKTL